MATQSIAAIRVESRSRKGVEHTVSEDGRFCTCEAARYGAADCWHRRFVRGFYEVIGEGHEHPELPVPGGCRTFSDVYGSPRYRVGFWRRGQFVRWEGEGYMPDALLWKKELERGAA